jgi:hypothetical protein
MHIIQFSFYKNRFIVSSIPVWIKMITSNARPNNAHTRFSPNFGAEEKAGASTEQTLRLGF